MRYYQSAMNVFIMILVFILMAGYYLIDTPGQRIKDTGVDAALRTNWVKSVLSCMVRSHSAAIEQDAEARAGANEELDSGGEPCTEKYNIQSVKLCADERREVSVCTPNRSGKTIGNFIITTADAPNAGDANMILEVLSREYEAAPNFGIAIEMDDNSFAILSGNGHRRRIPASIASSAELEEGRLIYITQYSASAEANLGQAKDSADNIMCMFGEQKVFRFNKWECMDSNPPVVCTGDKIWNSVTESCEMDPSRRPLCGSTQTAVQVEDLWQCVDPTPSRSCSEGMNVVLDYVSMEWYCVPNAAKSGATKCSGAKIAKGHILGGTLLRPGGLCNNCEKMITDEETCETACVPDAAKLDAPACYPRVSECRGSSRAFYFGFPNEPAYIAAARANVPELEGAQIPLDGMHSQNRRFNCLDCGQNGAVDGDRSQPPFVAVCEF
jgi:hypothetical protein